MLGPELELILRPGPEAGLARRLMLLSLEVLVACEAGLLAEEASEPWDESQEDPGEVEAWLLVAAQEVACSPRPPSCLEEEALG